MKRILLLLLIVCAHKITISQIITITPNMVFDETSQTDSYNMFDEAVLSGDPKNATGGSPVNPWYSPISSIHYPLYATIDLGRDYNLTDIYIHDFNGGGSASDSLNFYSGTPFNWNLMATNNLNLYNQWNANSTSVTTRYIRVKINNRNAVFNEVVLYGTPVGSVPTPPTPATRVYPLMDDFLGINSFHDDDLDKQQVVKFIREYHMWPWDQDDTVVTGKVYPNSEYAFSPSVVWGWDFDEYYRQSDSAGLQISPCMLRGPTFDGAGNYVWDSSELKPTYPWEDTYDPQSYIERADYLYQFAARYGKTAVSPSTLKLRSDNAPLSGLGYINYIEDWNEQNKYWHGRRGLFFPYEYAAMLSADYDGHQGALGPNLGVKAADPTMKVSMGGLALVKLDYIKAMKQWADHYRAGDFPADVLNVHFYSNDVGGQVIGSNPTHGIAPELDAFQADVQELVNYRDTFLPGKEVWVSEFGYDTWQSSPQKAQAYGPYTEYDVQAMWVIRTFLLLSSTGLDKAQMYMLRDVWDESGGMFDTGGLVHDMHDTIFTRYEPKVSWYYLYTMSNRLGRTKFKQQVASSNPNVMVYEYENAYSPDTSVYVLWCPTDNNTNVSGYSLNIGSGVTSATLVNAVNNDTVGVETNLVLTGSNVSVNVSENPIYVIVDKGTTSIAEEKKAKDFVIFPSVVSSNEEVTLSLNEAINGKVTIEILSNNGALVQQKVLENNTNQSLQLNVGDIAKGMYVVRISGEQTLLTHKLVVR